MKFAEAFKLLKKGKKIKLPSWGGYWYWDYCKNTIMMHTKEGEELDIRETNRVDYTFENICSEEWVVADDQNCPALGGINTFSFSEAIKYLKRGMRVKRAGWNGKDQYIVLGKNFTYDTPGVDVEKCTHMDIGSKAIVFVGTRGSQVGWLASQADMLAEDWTFVED